MTTKASGSRRASLVGMAAWLLAGAVAAAEPDASAVLRDAVLAAAAEALHAGDETGGGPAGVACAGDCNGDGRVSVDELVRAVSVALGLAALGDCTALDADGNGRIEIPDVIAAVARALDGCGVGAESVCGGPITSTPKLCNLTVSPRITTAFGMLRISFALSDLEGDLDAICGALALQSAPRPDFACDPLPQQGTAVNERVEIPPIQLQGARNGTYVLYLEIRDARGQRSAVATATFTVGVRA